MFIDIDNLKSTIADSLALARERESFKMYAFHLANHALVTCPLIRNLEQRKVYRYVAWAFKTLNSYLELSTITGDNSGSGKIQLIAHVVCGILHGSCESDIIDSRVLKSGLGVLIRLRRQNSWIVRHTILEFIADRLGVNLRRPILTGLL